MIRSLRKFIASYRLAKMVERNCKSFAVQEYVKRREASKKGWAMRSRARAGRASTEPASRLGLSATIAIARQP